MSKDSVGGFNLHYFVDKFKFKKIDKHRICKSNDGKEHLLSHGCLSIEIRREQSTLLLVPHTLSARSTVRWYTEFSCWKVDCSWKGMHLIDEIVCRDFFNIVWKKGYIYSELHRPQDEVCSMHNYSAMSWLYGLWWQQKGTSMNYCSYTPPHKGRQWILSLSFSSYHFRPNVKNREIMLLFFLWVVNWCGCNKASLGTSWEIWNVCMSSP